MSMMLPSLAQASATRSMISDLAAFLAAGGPCYEGGMEATGHNGAIFVGAPVEAWSERRVIEHVHAELSRSGLSFVLLANFELSGRQVDLLIVTEEAVIIVEVKTSRLPVRGEINGDWQRRDVAGRWLRYTNAYQQALGVKNRLRDAMRENSDITGYYPDATVVFAEPLPPGSSLTPGDFKVAVSELHRFEPRARSGTRNPWPLATWRTFAEDRSLRTATLEEVLAGPALEPAFSLLRDYRQRIEADLRGGLGWMPENDAERSRLEQASEQAPGCYISGPSGCGKTLAARWAGASLSRAGECVIFLAAKDYAGSWAQLLEREIALIVDAAPATLLRAIRATGSPVRIILDGLNELGPHRDTALRGLRALSRRLDARVIVTGQAVRPGDLAGLDEMALAPPSLELKERIAGARLPVISSNLRLLLKAVVSGFEAAVVAEIGMEVAPDASRQLLVDQFIRSRLGSSRTPGSAGLRRFASHQIEQTSYSMNETAFEELMVSNGVASADIAAMFVGGILSRRGGRVSFAHEILLNACAAFGFAQYASEAGGRFAAVLALPALAPIATDIVSVIEDEEVISAIMSTTKDQTLLYECARGLAGPIACQAVDQLLDTAEVRIGGEIAGLRLVVVPGVPAAVDWQEATLRSWNDAETAQLGALAREIATGHRIDRYFALCANMDSVLHTERNRIFDQASAAGIRALRSDSFRLAYSSFGEETGLGRISRMIGSGVFDLIDPTVPGVARDMLTLTSGQLYFYLERRRLFLNHVEVDDVADGLARLMTERFRWEPYLVKLAILHAATFVRSASPDKVRGLVAAIEEIDADRENLWISTAIIDALKFLGALDDSAEAARGSIAAEFSMALGADENDLVCTQALSVSDAMFDHPYDAIYGDLFEGLEQADRRRLMRRAARAPEVHKSAFYSWVVRELASFGDPVDAAAMADFARLPEPRNSMPQEEWGAFTLAIRFLGRHDLELPPLKGEGDVASALIQFRTLLYAAESGAHPGLADHAWDVLAGVSVNAVMGCLTEVEDALREQHWSEASGAPRMSLVNAYPEECLAAARRFLDGNAVAQHFHMAYGRDCALNLAFGIIELFGNRSDLARLRRLANGSPLAGLALQTLRTLDSA